MRILYAIIILLVGTMGLFAADENNQKNVSQSDAFKLNPDGSIALIPYNAKQQERMDKLAKEVDGYHAQINEKLKFLNYEKKVKDSRYGQVGYAREIKLPYEPNYVQHSRYVMKLKGGGGAEGGGFSLDEISFWTRKSLTSKNKEPVTTYRDLKNSVAGGGVKGLVLSVRTVTIADDNTNTYELEKIASPWERLRLASAYRDRLIEVLRTIDRYIMAKGKLEATEIGESILEVSIGGDFQEP
ncbi:LIC_12936 family protein [Leptospira idonii]|uniref:Uncharacterized protein n=1 Tax=Leptospira idonii TaxID=1193500 RepID=A0A4R9LZ98_9LEPT|nr:hypothetical protein [Leptospira idonii]TGN17360.1 hypothetical protein EHS15_17655 [Leptospira idonii]